MGALDFGTVVAFLLPGFVAFYALSYASARALHVFAASIEKDSGAGAVTILLLASLACGVLVSAVRSLLLDAIQFRTGVHKPILNFSRLANKDVLEAFREAIVNTYRFAQFYGNMLVAVGAVLSAKYWAQGGLKGQWMLFSVGVGSAMVLFVAHRKQLDLTYRRLSEILGNQEVVRGKEKKVDSKEGSQEKGSKKA